MAAHKPLVFVSGAQRQLDTAVDLLDCSITGSAASITGIYGGTLTSSQVTTALGFTPQAELTLTTTGTSGAATLIGNTLNIPQYSGGGSGTVTSVGLSLPSVFSVTGSPVTGAGTLTAALASQAVNTVFAGPSSGGSAAPTFRALVAADIPTLAQSKITNLSTDLAAKVAKNGDTMTGKLRVISGDCTLYLGTGDRASAYGFTGSSYFVVDKTSTADDASVVLRNNGNARAEIGLVTDDDIHFKTAAGTYPTETFTDRLIIKASGFVDVFNSKLRINAATGVPMFIVGNSDGSSAGAGVEVTYDQTNLQGWIRTIERGNTYRKLNLESNGIDFWQGAGSTAKVASLSNTGVLDAAGLTIGGVSVLTVPMTLSNAAKTLAAADTGKGYYKNNTTAYTYTIPDGLPDGTVFTIANCGSAGNITIAMSGTEVLRLAGTTTTGSRTVAPYGEATVHRVGGMWLCGGPGVT